MQHVDFDRFLSSVYPGTVRICNIEMTEVDALKVIAPNEYTLMFIEWQRQENVNLQVVQ